MAILKIKTRTGKLLGTFNTSFMPGYWRWSGKVDKHGRPREFRSIAFYELTTEERDALKQNGIELVHRELTLL